MYLKPIMGHIGSVLNQIFAPRIYVLASNGLTLFIFFCGSWWWRPRWLYAEWVPALIRQGLLSPTASPAYREVSFTRFALSLFIVILFVLWILSGLRGLRAAYRDGRLLWLIALGSVVTWTVFSIGWAADSEFIHDAQSASVLADARSQAAQWVLVLLFAFVVVCNGPAPRLVALALVSGMIVQGAVGMLQVALQHELGLAWLDGEIFKLGLHLYEFSLDPEESGIIVVQSEGIRYLRAYGITPHPNMLAGSLVMGLLASLWLWLEHRRTAAWVTMFGLWALFLTFSRAAVGGLVVGGASTIVGHYLSGYRRGFTAFAITVLLASLAFYVTFRPLVAVRVGQGNEGGASIEQISIEERHIYLEQAGQIIRQHPWQGIGIGTFHWASYNMLRQAYPHYEVNGQSVHRIYYLALAEVGLVGGVLVSGTLGIAAWLVWRRRWVLAPETVALGGGVVAWLAIGWFEFYMWSLLPYQVLFWGTLAAVLVPVNVDGNDRVDRQVGEDDLGRADPVASDV
ncbi:MAG: O-antigen ligase family protein [Chloroflexi bacterium]|nr:O-antigen ligase family protein [Chloroflexota bacterium]